MFSCHCLLVNGPLKVNTEVDYTKKKNNIQKRLKTFCNNIHKFLEN